MRQQQQQEQLGGWHGAPSDPRMSDTLPLGGPAPGRGHARPSTAPEHVPSEQLWHAAIRAALQAAATAAELRQVLHARRTAQPPPPRSEEPRAVA